MTNTERNLQDTKSQKRIPIPDKEHGFFNSATIALEPEAVFAACKDPENVKRVLSDLPKGIENFLDLQLVSAEKSSAQEYSLKWENASSSKVKGTLSFVLKKAPVNRGTILSAVATFDKFRTHEEGPSDLMNVFLKRMKSLIETGEIPTTKGQPSGREELSTAPKKTLH